MPAPLPFPSPPSLLPCIDLNLSSLGASEAQIASSLALPIPAVSTVVGSLVDYVSLLLSTGVSSVPQLQSVVSALGTAGFFNALVYPLWVVALVAAGIAVYATLTSKGNTKVAVIAAGALCAFTALLWAIFVGVVNGAIQDAITSFAASGLSYLTSSMLSVGVSVTWSIWAALVCGVIAAVAAALEKAGILR